MKKLLASFFVIFIILFSLSGCTTSPDFITSLKLNDEKRCVDTTIKASISSYLITPAGFDFEELNKKDYKMSITVTYDVYYKKDWNILGDIGYLGAPKFEVSILNDDAIVEMGQNITATLKSKTKSITYTKNVVNLIGSKISWNFSSDNIQNKIYNQCY